VHVSKLDLRVSHRLLECQFKICSGKGWDWNWKGEDWDTNSVVINGLVAVLSPEAEAIGNGMVEQVDVGFMDRSVILADCSNSGTIPAQSPW